ncbi:MAG: hypothetical protein ACI4KF_13415 [Huintestinicola sp.]
MGKARNWTAEEEEYLQQAWGNVSIPNICKKLNRSEHAIKVRVFRMGLGAFTESGDYISYLQLSRALYNRSDVRTDYTRNRELWMRNGLNIRQKKVGSSKVWVVNIEDFWKFAEKNKSLFDFSKMEKNALGAEPAWLAEKRRLDVLAHINNATQSKWTPYELSLLKLYASQQAKKYSVNELAKMLGRSEGAVLRKCRDLGYKIKICRNKPRPFYIDELNYIVQEIKKGSTYSVIASTVGRSEKSIRGAVYHRLGTEKLNEVQKLLQSGADFPYMPQNIPHRKGVKTNGNTETIND